MIGSGKVDSILKYNAIGFDMDHTFLRYKMRTFIKLVNQATTIFLVSKRGYPQDIFPLDDDDAKVKYKMWFRAVFDHKTGNLLKIGSNNLIMRGYHGFTPLTRDQILQTYGKNPLLENFEVLSSRHPDFSNLHEFYAASIVPLLAQIVSCKTLQKFEVLNEKNYYDIMNDVNAAHDYNYNIEDIETFKKNDYHGFFYPKLLTEPRHYVHKTSQVLIERLKKLKERGIKIFLASNNHYEVAVKLMTEAIGKDWIDMFDFVIFNARKPKFFSSNIELPVFLDFQRKIVEDPNEAFSGAKKGEEKVLIGGHAEYLNQYLRGNVKKDFKILFFGDTIVTDCVYAFDKTHQKYWDIVLIMEELQELENGYREKEYFGYWQWWGSAILDKNIYSGVDKTVIFEFADNTAHRSFSILDSPECLEFLKI